MTLISIGSPVDRREPTLLGNYKRAPVRVRRRRRRVSHRRRRQALSRLRERNRGERARLRRRRTQGGAARRGRRADSRRRISTRRRRASASPRRCVEKSFADEGVLLQLGRGSERRRVQVRASLGAHAGAMRSTRSSRCAARFTAGCSARSPRPTVRRIAFRSARWRRASRSSSATSKISRVALDAETAAAVILEPVQGEGGVRVLDAGFVRELRALTTERDVALIFDEIQCGLGRTGTLFAYEQFGVEPDILTLAKPIAGGLPMGAVLDDGRRSRRRSSRAITARRSAAGRSSRRSRTMCSSGCPIRRCSSTCRENGAWFGKQLNEIAQSHGPHSRRARHGLHVGHRRHGHGVARRERGVRGRAARLHGRRVHRAAAAAARRDARRARARARHSRRGPVMSSRSVVIRRARASDARRSRASSARSPTRR